MKSYVYQIISTLFSLLSTILSSKQNILKWPISIIANLIAILVYYNSELYIKCSLAIIFIINSFYGWYNWLYGGINKTKLKVTRTKYRDLIKYIFLVSSIILITGKIEKRFTNSTLSYLEAFAIFSILAHWMLARKKIENWIIWITIDIIFIFICIYKSIYIFALKYLVYTLLAIYAFYSWKKSLKIHKN